MSAAVPLAAPTIYALPSTPKSGIKKFCSLCKQEKDIEDFALDRRYRDGHRWHCTAHVNPGTRPAMRYCPMCRCDREETLFPAEQHNHHPAGKTLRRWYCVVGQELVPSDVREFEREKRRLWQIKREIDKHATELQQKLSGNVGKGPNTAFSEGLDGIRRTLAALWKSWRELRCKLLADASELQHLLFDGSGLRPGQPAARAA